MSWEDQIMDTMQTPAEDFIDLQYIHTMEWNWVGNSDLYRTTFQ